MCVEGGASLQVFFSIAAAPFYSYDVRTTFLLKLPLAGRNLIFYLTNNIK